MTVQAAQGRWRENALRAVALIGVASALTTGTAAIPAQAATAGVPRGVKYVAMGSSFAAGPGITPTKPGSPAGCERSADNYASKVAARLGLALTDVTCSGATTADILTTGQDGQPPQISAVAADTRLVTVTIGGNDVDYLGSLIDYSCQDTQRSPCGAVDQDAIGTALKTVHTKIGDVVAAVHRRAPKAQVLLVNYLTVLPTSGVCSGVPLTAAQAGFERNVAARLRSATQQAAAAQRATVIDAASASIGHDACSATPWVEKYDVPSGHTPYHPKPNGMAAVADMITASLG
ncbi:SGNH/GDSL hydrolase family protein [Streptomyces sp. WZ-12]|uniref:SGNH/GDSL hydrolase family protein n=1 Tax=Streptomyces sp. WZ-12 TaxID=3030210 RepID=UPI002380E5AA|nr:SGNH/GDSL hydrolase family protein [Streptomyces sp. WZ-12]